MKPSTIVFLVFAELGMFGYLCYGWLLLETLSSEKGLLASFTFTNLFMPWLLPLIIGLVLLALKLIRKKQGSVKSTVDRSTCKKSVDVPSPRKERRI